MKTILARSSLLLLLLAPSLGCDLPAVRVKTEHSTEHRVDSPDAVKAAEAVERGLKDVLSPLPLLKEFDKKNERIRELEAQLLAARSGAADGRPALDPPPLSVVGKYRPIYHSNIPGVLSYVEDLGTNDQFRFRNDGDDPRWRKGVVFTYDRRKRVFVAEDGPERCHFFESNHKIAFDDEGMWLPSN